MSPFTGISLPVNITEYHVAPIKLVEDHIHRLHLAGVSKKQMLPKLSRHYDTESYGLGCILYSLPSPPRFQHGF